MGIAVRQAVFVGLLAFVAVLLVNCGGGEADQATSTATATVPGRPTPPSATLPDPLPPPAEEITVPNGFYIYTFADGFDNLTALAFDPEGILTVAERGGNVKTVADTDGDGVADEVRTIASGFENLLGIAFAPDGNLYASHEGTISLLLDTDEDRRIDEVVDVITDLPHAGLHLNNNMIFGPDGKLYVANGSTCNDCVEPNERSAVILRADPDGSNFEIFARGLRNVYDLTFNARGELWATDNGSDPPCNTLDELNFIEQGKHYGWPYCTHDPSAPDNPRAPVAELGLNTASTGIIAYESDQFPGEYRNDFFVILWGALHRRPDPGEGVIGRKLVRVKVRRLDEVAEDATPYEGTMELFAAGFGNPIDVAVDALGTLYVADFTTGKIYRILWVG